MLTVLNRDLGFRGTVGPSYGPLPLYIQIRSMGFHCIPIYAYGVIYQGTQIKGSPKAQTPNP